MIQVLKYFLIFPTITIYNKIFISEMDYIIIFIAKTRMVHRNTVFVKSLFCLEKKEQQRFL